jgi:hypothetical protein
MGFHLTVWDSPHPPSLYFLKSVLDLVLIFLDCLFQKPAIMPCMLFWESSSLQRLSSITSCTEKKNVHIGCVWLHQHDKCLAKGILQQHGMSFLKFFHISYLTHNPLLRGKLIVFSSALVLYS